MDSFLVWKQVKEAMGDHYDPLYHLFRSCEIGNESMVKILFGK